MTIMSPVYILGRPEVSFKDSPASPKDCKNSTVFVAPSITFAYSTPFNKTRALSEKLGDCAFLKTLHTFQQLANDHISLYIDRVT